MPINTSKTVVEIDADNAKYLKAVQGMRREEERAEKARDLAIARSLKAQGELTEESFRTAKAAGTHAEAVADVEKQVSLTSRAMDVLGTRVKAVGMSILSGFGAGLVAGVLGGSVSSLISKAFAPPTDAELAQWAKFDSTITGEIGIWTKHKDALAAWAREQIAAKKAADLEKASQEGLSKVLEDITHKNTIELLAQQIVDLNKQHQAGTIAVDDYKEAWVRLKNAIEEARGSAVRYQTSGVNVGLTATVGKPVITAAYSAGRIADYDEWFRDPDGRAAGRTIDDWRKWKQQPHGPATPAFGPKPTDTLFGRGVDYLNLIASRQEADRLANLRAVQGDSFGGFATDATDATGDLEDLNKAFDKVRQKGADVANDKLAAYNAQSPLEKIFGTSQEAQALGEAFGGFADAAGEAFGAIVTGSEGAGKAFAKFLSGSLLGIGKKAAVQAIYEVALAISEPWDAGRHLLAAGKFAATAVAAGVAAAALGGGGGGGATAGAGGGAAPTGSYGTYAGSPGGGGMTFVYGDSFADDSPRMRARKAAQLIRRAQRDSGPGNGPDDVRYQ